MIDAHTHLWELGSGNYPWLESGPGFGALSGIERIRSDYLPVDYRRDSAGQGVVATIHVEALWNSDRSPVEETRWLETLASRPGVADRYVAAAPLGKPDGATILDEQASFERVSGIRQVIQWHPDPARSAQPSPGLTREPDWLRDVTRLASHGLVLDLLMFPWQAEEVVELANRLPELTIVINHAGTPADRSREGIELWLRGVDLLASRPNIFMKISALGLPDGDPRWGEEGSFGFLIRSVLEAFGPERCMFASDFPFGRRVDITLAEIFERFRQIAATLPAPQQHDLFYGTAERLYFRRS